MPHAHALPGNCNWGPPCLVPWPPRCCCGLLPHPDLNLYIHVHVCTLYSILYTNNPLRAQSATSARTAPTLYCPVFISPVASACAPHYGRRSGRLRPLECKFAALFAGAVGITAPSGHAVGIRYARLTELEGYVLIRQKRETALALALLARGLAVFPVIKNDRNKLGQLQPPSWRAPYETYKV
jgi:hypothetical protein